MTRGTTARARTRGAASAFAVHAVLLGYTAVALFPVALVLLNSLKNRRGIFTEPLGLPGEATGSLEGYATVL